MPSNDKVLSTVFWWMRCVGEPSCSSDNTCYISALYSILYPQIWFNFKCSFSDNSVQFTSWYKLWINEHKYFQFTLFSMSLYKPLFHKDIKICSCSSTPLHLKKLKIFIDKIFIRYKFCWESLLLLHPEKIFINVFLDLCVLDNFISILNIKLK